MFVLSRPNAVSSPAAAFRPGRGYLGVCCIGEGRAGVGGSIERLTYMWRGGVALVLSRQGGAEYGGGAESPLQSSYSTFITLVVYVPFVDYSGLVSVLRFSTPHYLTVASGDGDGDGDGDDNVSLHE
ncbi:hypothetical protein ACLB2K_014271 [Fragaria x ananassa]